MVQASFQKIKRLAAAALLLALSLASFALPFSALAATQYLAPASGNYTGSFSTSVFVSSTDTAINAVSGRVTFPSDTLRVKSISKSGSIVSLWAAEPTAGNGFVSFEGVILNPGYTGSGGKILTVTFDVIGGTSATVGIGGASVLANDGIGTNVLRGTGSAQFTFGPPDASTPQPPGTPTPPEPPKDKNFAIPVVSSATNPNPETWYNVESPEFTWQLPAGVTGVRYSVTPGAPGQPGGQSVGLAKKYIHDRSAEGLSYFNISFKGADSWGPVTSFAFRVDRTAPADLSVKRLADERKHLVFEVTAADTLSGLDHYEYSLDGAPVTSWIDDGSHILRTSLPATGEHALKVTAFDRAGNTSSASVPLVIAEPAPSSIAALGQQSVLLVGFVAGIAFVIIMWLAIYFLRLFAAEIGLARAIAALHPFRRSERALHRALRVLSRDAARLARRKGSLPPAVKTEVSRLEKSIGDGIKRLH